MQWNLTPLKVGLMDHFKKIISWWVVLVPPGAPKSACHTLLIKYLATTYSFVGIQNKLNVAIFS